MMKKKRCLFMLFVAFSCLFGNISAGRRARKKHLRSSFFTRPRPTRPNIVFIMTDDQDVMLGSVEFMNKTIKILRNRGADFINGFVTTPICCPSRSSILTGIYVHNHHVMTNNQNCTGPEWRNTFEPLTFGPYLKNAGYRTGYFGKYLNEYNGSYVPPGWNEWVGLIKNSRFYNYSINHNGEKIKHGDDYRKDYFTDLIANDSLVFLKKQRRKFPTHPLFMVLSFPAPHGPEDPAPAFNDLFVGVDTHRTPAWNYAPNPDKEWLLKRTGKMEPVHVVFTDLLHRRRLQTLQSVDMALHKVVSELRDMRELSNTYVIFTSDHGYHLGQFGLIKGKNMPYEFDLKVPYMIRGPGIPKGIRIQDPVANIDLAPTILDMAGVKIPDNMDGRSVLPLIQTNPKTSANIGINSLPWRQTLLIERGKMPKLRKVRYRLMKQRDRFSKDMRIQSECQKDTYSSPCRPFQQWECRLNDVGRWRIFKCRGRVSLEKECRCSRRKRARRSTTNTDSNQKTYNVHEEVLLSDWEKMGNHSDSAMLNIPESLINQWENEFFNQITQKEITENNEWHQGVFDAVENGDQFQWDDFEADTVKSRRLRRAVERSHRRRHEKRRTRRKEGDFDDLFLTEKCLAYANTSIMCQPEVYTDYGSWLSQKSNLDQRIRKMRQKLQAAKDIRKHLKKGRPEGESEQSVTTPPEQETPKLCHCSVGVASQQHPLRFPTYRYISDADVLNYQISRRVNRKGRRKGRGRKGRRGREKKKYCNIPMMNCFIHDPDHWKTPPLWPKALGDFCFCQNSNNNSYWCLRTVNTTHNFLYCEFITDFVSYYDISKDVHQLRNTVYKLNIGVLEQLSAQLGKLKACKGWRDCERYSEHISAQSHDTTEKSATDKNEPT